MSVFENRESYNEQRVSNGMESIFKTVEGAIPKIKRQYSDEAEKAMRRSSRFGRTAVTSSQWDIEITDFPRGITEADKKEILRRAQGHFSGASEGARSKGAMNVRLRQEGAYPMGYLGNIECKWQDDIFFVILH